MLAGLCGGLAEVVWVALYSSFTQASGVEVARQVTATLFPSSAASALAPAFGIVIHLLLSLALGFAFAWLVWIPFSRQMRAATAMIIAVATLIFVWAANFFVILPALNPVFVTLMPYGATLLSKALFGIAMAWGLQRGPELEMEPAASWARQP